MAAPAPTNKPRVIKDYDKLADEVVEQIKLEYPRGFEDNLVKFTNAAGDQVSALPFETEDRYYLVRMTVKQAIAIIAKDEDYDEHGNLKARAKRVYTDRYSDDDDDDDEDSDSLINSAEFDLDVGDADLDDDDELGNTKQDGTVGLDGIDVVDPGTV